MDLQDIGNRLLSSLRHPGLDPGSIIPTLA
jgi:hypothetical protein